MPHTTTVQVRWGDVDPAGIVFYPRFFEWYDLGTETLFESLGMPWPEIFPRYAIVGVPIVESASAFLSPARYGDIVSIASRVDWVRNRTFRAEHDIAVAGRPCARGFEIRASVGAAGGAGCPAVCPTRFHRKWRRGAGELPRPGATLTLEVLTRFLLQEQRIARFKAPERLELRERLPTTAVGKVAKNLLREEIRSALGREGGAS